MINAISFRLLSRDRKQKKVSMGGIGGGAV